MANEVTKVNGVTKREYQGKFYYSFPLAFITADPTLTGQENVVYYIPTSGAIPVTVLYADITDKLGSTNVEEYVDALANLEYYFTVDFKNEIESQFVTVQSDESLSTTANNQREINIENKEAIELLQMTTLVANSSISQNLLGSDVTPVAVLFQTIDEIDNVVFTNDSELEFLTEEKVRAEVSLHLTKQGGGSDLVEFWLQIDDGNGWLDLPDTGERYNFTGTNEGVVVYVFKGTSMLNLKYRLVASTADNVTLENQTLDNNPNVFVPGAKIAL